jgi:hypothetical protein
MFIEKPFRSITIEFTDGTFVELHSGIINRMEYHLDMVAPKGNFINAPDLKINIKLEVPYTKGCDRMTVTVPDK